MEKENVQFDLPKRDDAIREFAKITERVIRKRQTAKGAGKPGNDNIVRQDENQR